MIKKIVMLALLTNSILATSDIDFNTNDRERRSDTKDFHIRAGYAYSSWKTEEMRNFKMENKGLNVAWAEFIYKDYYSPIFYPKFLLHLEHSFNKSEKPNEVFETKKSVDLDDSYLKILGTLRFDYGIFLNYEYEKFSSVVESLYHDNYFVDETGRLNPFPLQSKLISETIFRDYSIGYKYEGVDIYAFYSDYQKPYTINRYSQEVNQLANLLLYPQLTSYGIGFKAYWGTDDFYVLPELKIGKGKLELTDDIEYKDFVGIDDVTYIGLKVKIGYVGEFTDSLNYHLMYQGEVREFSESDSNSEDTDINQDITHKLMLSLQYSF